MPKKIITRFSPSPTGYLHVGGLRTALYNYLFTKKNKGDFLLRIEDTDQARKVEGAKENLEKTLKDFGLKWDNKKIVIQSERLKKYQKAADKLIKENKAYYCFCTKERLDEIRKDQQAKNLPPMYDRHCCGLPKTEIDTQLKNKTPFVIRLKMSREGNTDFTDLIRGQVSFANKLIDDQVIIKSDGYPTYHLASVVDDNDMNITHVIRGEEWLPSTPKHVQIYKALGFDIPEFAHLPLLLNPDKSKLSKRQGDVSVEDFVAKGYLPQTLLNFVLLLGWNPGTDKEIFSFEEMIKAFSLEKVNKAGAVFNIEKLDWMNGEYIKNLSDKELANLAKPFFDQAGIKTDVKYLTKVVATEKTRIKKIDELITSTTFFFDRPKYNARDLVWKKSNLADTIKYLENIIDFLSDIKEKDWNNKLEEITKEHIIKNGWQLGDTLWPMRFALSGSKASPSPFEIATTLGKKETIQRLGQAIVSLADLEK